MGQLLFRRSSSLRARGVSQTFDRLSQNSVGKFEGRRRPPLDLACLAGGSSCGGSPLRRLFRFCDVAMGGHGLDCGRADVTGGCLASVVDTRQGKTKVGVFLLAAASPMRALFVPCFQPELPCLAASVLSYVAGIRVRAVLSGSEPDDDLDTFKTKLGFSYTIFSQPSFYLLSI